MSNSIDMETFSSGDKEIRTPSEEFNEEAETLTRIFNREIHMVGFRLKLGARKISLAAVLEGNIPAVDCGAWEATKGRPFGEVSVSDADGTELWTFPRPEIRLAVGRAAQVRLAWEWDARAPSDPATREAKLEARQQEVVSALAILSAMFGEEVRRDEPVNVVFSVDPTPPKGELL